MFPKYYRSSQMKPILCTLLGLCLFVFGCKQPPTNDDLPQFEIEFAQVGNQEANRLIAVDDGIIMIGTSTIGNSDHLLLQKTDFSGILQWQRTYSEGTRGFGISPTLDGNLMVVGGITDESGDMNMLVAKTDMEGQVLWQNDFGGPLTDFGRDVQPFVSQGQTLLLGTTQSFGSGVASIYLVCIDIDGNEVWSKTYGGIGLDGGSELESSDPLWPVILGFTESFGAGGRDIYLQGIDQVGDSTWSTTIGGLGYEESQAISRLHNESGFILSSHSDSNEPSHLLHATKVNGTGEVVWEKEFGTAIAHEGGEGVLSDSDGNYVFLGRTNSFGNDEQVYFIKTDSDGNVLEELNFGEEGDQRGNDIIEYNGAYYICGSSLRNGDSDVLLIKRAMN